MIKIPYLDLKQKYLNSKSEFDVAYSKIMSSGNLVSDELLNEIILEKLNSNQCNNGFILDGYPRTLSQSEFLLSFFNNNKLKIDIIFDFKVDFNIVEQRILFRSEKEKRSDDNMKVVKNRLDKYMQETYPVSQFFKSNFNKNYHTIDASGKISEIQTELMKILKKGEF